MDELNKKEFQSAVVWKEIFQFTVEKYRDVIEGKCTNAQTAKLKLAIWFTIANRYDKNPLHPRKSRATLAIENFKEKANKLHGTRRKQLMTGGKPSEIFENPIPEKVKM